MRNTELNGARLKVADPTPLEVAVGVVKNPAGQVLISLRHPSLHQGGLWEFPGGKIEAGETAEQALRRELNEELDITVLAASPLITINHRYPDKAVRLYVFLVEQFAGDAKACHGQPVKWVEASELTDYAFPAANRPIITAARLPANYAILDDEDESLLRVNLDKILARGVKLIQARLKNLPAERVEKFLAEAYPLCKKKGATLLLNSAAAFTHDGAQGVTQGAVTDGIHLTSRQLMSLAERPHYYRWVAASCHNLEQLQHAEAIGVDFIVLAPVLPTKTHPDVNPLGWEQFADLVSKVNIPVYALGGLTLDDLTTARQSGAQGIAGISAFLE